jgi:hypothetical protein
MDWETIGSIALGLLPNAIWGLLVIVMPAIVAYLAKVKSQWSWAHTIIGIMGSLALGLFIYNNIHVEWPVTSRAIEAQLRDWAYNSGFGVEDYRQQNARFSFLIKDDTGLYTTIINKQDASPNEIIIAIRMTPAENLQKLFQSKSQEAQNKIRADLNVELLKFGVEFELPSSQSLSNITVSKVMLYKRTMTQQDFLENLFIVRRASYLINNLVCSFLSFPQHT